MSVCGADRGQPWSLPARAHASQDGGDGVLTPTPTPRFKIRSYDTTNLTLAHLAFVIPTLEAPPVYSTLQFSSSGDEVSGATARSSTSRSPARALQCGFATLSSVALGEGPKVDFSLEITAWQVREREGYKLLSAV